MMAAVVVASAAGVVQVMRRALGDKKTSTTLRGPLGRPYGSFPVNSVERTPPDVAAAGWVLIVDGLVERPLRFDRASWEALPRVAKTADFHCVEGWSVEDVRWEGVALAVILDHAGLKPEAEHVTFRAYRSAYSDSIPLELVRDPLTLLADRVDGQPLPAEHGGPLRLVVSRQLGYKSVKWVDRLEVTALLEEDDARLGKPVAHDHPRHARAWVVRQGGAGGAGIQPEDGDPARLVAAVADLGAVRVAVHEQPEALGAWIRVRRPEVAALVDDGEVQTGHLTEGFAGQPEAERVAVAVATDDADRRQPRQPVEDVTGADVAGVDDVVRAGARVDHALRQQPVGVGDDRDPRVSRHRQRLLGGRSTPADGSLAASLPTSMPEAQTF
jgi:DMSO/TMAO reductase YedYZ molybdopterin-dependent catalytic subunit